MNGGCLPHEVLLNIFHNFGHPLDLYNASLSCRTWRSVAVDPRLWEDHYTRFYRARGGRDDPLRRWLEHSRHEAMRFWIKGAANFASSNSSGSSTTSTSPFSAASALPPFLDYTLEAKRADFHDLFIKRMNTDQRLLASLVDLIHLKAGILDDMLNIVDAYSDEARDFLAALAADQQVNEETLWAFAQQEDEVHGSDANLRAVDIHSRAATGQPRPHTTHCLSLQYAARQVLAHLQRRDAIHSMGAFRERWEDLEDDAETFRERVLRRSGTVEEGFEIFALFGQGERCEVGQYLDLLALYLWSRLTNQHQRTSRSTARLERSTRTKVRFIVQVMRELDFGRLTVANAAWMDANNGFPNIALACPRYRKSVDYTHLGIFCAVARRLGVAATLLPASTGFVAIIVEDGAAPVEWPGDSAAQEWGRFCLLPANEGEDGIVELGAAKSWLSSGSSSAEDFFDEPLDSASPCQILRRGLSFFQFLARHDWREIRNAFAAESGEQGRLSIRAMPGAAREAKNDLEALDDYLSGRASTPPWPLSPALHPSSLAFLPSTRPGAPRTLSRARHQDAEGVTAWIFRVMAPRRQGGPRHINDHIIKACLNVDAFSPPHLLDLPLLLEVNEGNVAEELALARSGAPPDEEQEDLKSPYGYDPLPPHPTPGMRRFAAKVLKLDRSPCCAVAGVKGTPVSAEERDQAALRLNDKSLPAKKRAKYGIGTVFRHRTEGYCGVVIGRDSNCRASDDWIDEKEIVSGALGLHVFLTSHADRPFHAGRTPLGRAQSALL